MRKQDRIANQQQSRSSESSQEKKGFAQKPTDQERVKGSASEPPRPQRTPGKLPLPD